MKENMKNRIRAYADMAVNMEVRKQPGGVASSASESDVGKTKMGLGVGGGCLR